MSPPVAGRPITPRPPLGRILRARLQPTQVGGDRAIPGAVRKISHRDPHPDPWRCLHDTAIRQASARTIEAHRPGWNRRQRGQAIRRTSLASSRETKCDLLVQRYASVLPSFASGLSNAAPPDLKLRQFREREAARHAPVGTLQRDRLKAERGARAAADADAKVLLESSSQAPALRKRTRGHFLDKLQSLG